jgi:hypothetical protein
MTNGDCEFVTLGDNETSISGEGGSKTRFVCMAISLFGLAYVSNLMGDLNNNCLHIRFCDIMMN